MRICIINSVFGYGSTGVIIERIMDDLVANGHEVHIIYSRNNDIDNEWIHRFYDRIGFYFHVLDGVLLNRHGRASKRNTTQIIDCIDRIKPDLVNCHNLHGFYVNYVRLFDHLRKLNIPIVYTLHDCWAFTGYCSHFTRSGCQQWKSGCRQCRVHNVYPYRLFGNSHANFVLKESSYMNQRLYVVTPSNWLKAQVGQSVLSCFPCRVIHNDIDVTVFNDRRNVFRSESNKAKIILAVASIWTKSKGMGDLEILASQLDNRFQVVVIGKSSERIKNVVSISRASAQQLAEWYNKAFCFVNLTYEDTYPTVNREALACGCPVITYDTGGCSELCNSQHNVVKVGDIQRVIDLIATDRFEHHVEPIIDQTSMAVHYRRLFESVLLSDGSIHSLKEGF